MSYVYNSSFSSILEEDNKVNLFFLPQHTSHEYTAAFEEFKYQMLSMPKRDQPKFGEREWLRSAGRIWTEIENSRALSQYVRIIQKQGIFRNG